ncbi:uncharacterized protein LOC106882208 isoform X1 [Octopus bimaculoides]|uniref:Uncharacterized protein n=1 Tax=Octopus bimaculoides TaxID=37653 RepID=A0A0L8FNI8_OCTBM|nr:uncharacterized protein LOC106882208 isoform X1 [Octopus bimaculoides]|eukprot:XP_014788289.1 PREDICTED: uncharacterized protein LOC106882208 isoform X1 [Octopus bimaculoides]
MLKLNPEERKQIQNFVSEAKRYEDSKMEKFNNIKTPTKKEEEQNVMLSLIERMKAFFQSLSPFFRHGSGKVLFLGLSLYLVFLHLRVEYSVFGIRDITHKLFQIYQRQFKSNDSKT